MKKLTLFVLVVALIASLAIPAMADEEEYQCNWGTPTVDAEKDACYTFIKTVDASSPMILKSDDYDGNVSADFYLCNDDEYLYIYVEVKDGSVVDVLAKSWVKDSAEIWLKNPDNDIFCKVPFDAFCGDHGHVADNREGAEYYGPGMLSEDVPCASKRTNDGYVIEGAIPFDVDAVIYEDEMCVEIGLQINDFNDENATGSGDWMGLFGNQVRGSDVGYPLYLATEAPETEAPAEETQAPAEETQAPAEETQAPAEETQAPAEETEAPSDDPSPVTADIAVIAAGIALAAAAVVVFKKH